MASHQARQNVSFSSWFLLHDLNVHIRCDSADGVPRCRFARDGWRMIRAGRTTRRGSARHLLPNWANDPGQTAVS